MNILWVAISAFAGGMVSAVLGWLDSGEAFNIRKFSASMVRVLIAGVVFAIGYSYSNGITVMDVCIAFVGGAGADAIINRASGYVSSLTGR